MPQLQDSNGFVIPGAFPVGTIQSKAYDASAAIDNAVGADTKLVEITVTTAAYVAIGTTPTATSANQLVPALMPVVLPIKPGDKVAAIKLASAGSLIVREIS